MTGPARRDKTSRVLVIVPAFNEEEAIRGVLAELERDAPAFDVLVVNDGSTDETVTVVRETGHQLLDLPLNLGVGGAVQAGFKYAIEHGYRAAVQMDGDGQHVADQIHSLVEPVLAGAHDMSIGSRYLGEPEKYDGSLLRRTGTRFLSWFCTVAARQRITDATSGFRAFGPRAIRYLASYYPADYPEPECVILLSRRGLTICEVPVRMRARQAGRSSISGTVPIYYMVKVSLSLLMAFFKEGPRGQST